MAKIKQNQRFELRQAFDRVFRHEHRSTIKNYLFARDELLIQAWSSFEQRLDYSFSINGESLCVPFSKIPPTLEGPSNTAVTSKPLDVLPITKPKKGRGLGKNPVKQVTSVALDPDLLAVLNERSLREDRTVSSLIRLAIKHYLECVK